MWIAGCLPATIQMIICRTVFSALAKNEPTEGSKNLLGLHDNLLWDIDQCAIRYEKGIHPKHRLTNYHRFFVERLHDGDRVLDIGCGIGVLASSMAESGADVTAIDINADHITSARRKYSRSGVNFINGDATKDLPNEKFDIVVLSNVLEHIEDRSGLLMSLNATFTPRSFLIRVPMINRDWIVPFKKELGMPYFCDPTHCIEYTFDDFCQEMKSAGLVISSYEIKWGEIWAVIQPQK